MQTVVEQAIGQGALRFHQGISETNNGAYAKIDSSNKGRHVIADSHVGMGKLDRILRKRKTRSTSLRTDSLVRTKHDVGGRLDAETPT